MTFFPKEVFTSLLAIYWELNEFEMQMAYLKHLDLLNLAMAILYFDVCRF